MTARYEDDPRWQAANARHIADRAPDETPTDHLLRSVQAASEKFQIECEYEGGAA